MKKSAIFYPINIPAMVFNVFWGVFWFWKMVPTLQDMNDGGNFILLFLLGITTFWGPPIFVGIFLGVMAGTGYHDKRKDDRHGQQNMIFHILALNEEREQQSNITYHGISEGVKDRYDYQFSNDDLSARLAGLWLEGYVIADGNNYRLSQKGKDELKGQSFPRGENG